MSDVLHVRPLVKYHRSSATVPMALVTYCAFASPILCGHVAGPVPAWLHLLLGLIPPLLQTAAFCAHGHQRWTTVQVQDGSLIATQPCQASLRPMQDRAGRTTFLPSSKTSISGRIFPTNSHAISCEIIAHDRSLHRESRGKEKQVNSSQRLSGLSQGFRVSQVHSGDRCWKTQRNPRKTRSPHTSSIASWSHFPLHTNVFPASDLVLEFYVQSPE